MGRLACGRHLREITERTAERPRTPEACTLESECAGTEDGLERDYESPKYEHPVDDINWTAGVGRPAGIYWLDGDTVIAAHDSPAEARLLSLGAIPVATLRFDADPLERVHAGRIVERLNAARASRILITTGHN